MVIEIKTNCGAYWAHKAKNYKTVSPTTKQTGYHHKNSKPPVPNHEGFLQKLIQRIWPQKLHSKIKKTLLSQSKEKILVDFKQKLIEQNSSALADKVNINNFQSVQLMLKHNFPVEEVEKIAERTDKKNDIILRQVFKAYKNNAQHPENNEITTERINNLLDTRNKYNYSSIMKLLKVKNPEGKTLFNFESVIKIAKDVDSSAKSNFLNHVLPPDSKDTVIGSVDEVKKLVGSWK